MPTIFLPLVFVAGLAYCQDKPDADKPILRVDAATISKHPFDYLGSHKPIDLYGTKISGEQISPTQRRLTFSSTTDYSAKDIVVLISEDQFKMLQKKLRVFVQLDSVDDRVGIKATALGNRVDLEGINMHPKFSWSPN